MTDAEKNTWERVSDALIKLRREQAPDDSIFMHLCGAIITVGDFRRMAAEWDAKGVKNDDRR